MTDEAGSGDSCKLQWAELEPGHPMFRFLCTTMGGQRVWRQQRTVLRGWGARSSSHALFYLDEGVSHDSPISAKGHSLILLSLLHLAHLEAASVLVTVCPTSLTGLQDPSLIHFLFICLFVF